MMTAAPPSQSGPDTPADAQDITLVLQSLRAGDGRASSELLPLVYDELRRLAAARMAQETGSGRGRIGRIFLGRRRRRCGGFWWRMRGERRA